MDAFGHTLTAAVLAVVLRWLWKSSAIEKATFQSGRKNFPPTRAIRLLTTSTGIIFAALLIWASYSVHRPSERWVPYLFAAFLAVVPFMYPPMLTIEVDGIASRAWYGNEKKMRWEEVASLHYNTGNRQFIVRDSHGRKITHAGFNADGDSFREEIQGRTRLPVQIARPGTWKVDRFEVPYEEIEAERPQQG